MSGTDNTAHLASQPHERMMFNIAIFHFLLPAILFATENLWLIFSVPIACSLMMILSIWIQAHRPANKTELVLAHWQCAWRRSRFLIVSYAVSLVLFLIAWGVLQGQEDANMRMIQLAVVGWFCLIPISLTIVGLIILETSALAQARRGIMPQKMRL